MGKLFKFLIALVLLPLVAAQVWTLIDLARISAPAGSWHESWFVSLGAGFVAWLLIFSFLPRTLWLYVLGHELTHALAAMLAGGKVTAFQVKSSGGHILTDRVNWWIALSPYFVPIYALIWMGLWLTVDFYHSLKPWQMGFYFGLGFFWAFHMTFTASMLHPRQSDLSREGYIFSTVIIALFNFFAVLLLLALLIHDFPRALSLFGRHVEVCYVIGATHSWTWMRKVTTALLSR
jgi:hypothetical protein